MQDFNIFNEYLYNTRYHSEDISKFKFLITGGAGFIGSNLVEYLLRYNAGYVRVIDNLSNGSYDNIKNFVGLPNFEFIKGDIRDINLCRQVVDDMDFISHQAALGSVPRSINDPLLSNDVNITGFLNMLTAAKESTKLRRMIYAASSSTYGDSLELPKKEGIEGNPLSPYAVTKLVNELYADVFSRVYDFHAIGLRYFNVFGPKQSPDNPYAAVIPLFCRHFINDTSPIINGDGETSRDFTFVENAVQANIKLMFAPQSRLKDLENQYNSSLIFNVACGDQITLNQVVSVLGEISGKKHIKPNYGPERKGDIRHSMASIEKIKSACDYEPKILFSEGLRIVYNWYNK